VTIAQNAFLISWLVQAALAFTFTVALWGLALQLKRPGARILAWSWVLVTVGAGGAAVQALTQPDSGRLISGTFSMVLVGIVFASVPMVRAASVAVTTGGRVKQKYAGEATLLAIAGTVTAMLATSLGARLGPPDSLAILFIPRSLIALAYLAGAVAIWRVRAAAHRRYRTVLAVYALGAVAQVPRAFLPAILDAWSRDPAVADLAINLFIVQHVLAIVILGVTSFLVAIAEERFATFDQGRRLKDTALRLERMQRLESLGRLAGGVAHDFNNLLTAITASSQLARDSLSDPAEVRHELDAIEEASARGAALTKQLRDYARVTPREPERFDLGGRLESTGAFLRRLVEPKAKLHVIPTLPGLTVKMDPTQFDQVLMNLVVNARDAMPEGGTVTARAEPHRVEGSSAEGEAELPAGEYVRLTVHDTGVGVPPDLARTIFEPFFTTKATTGGTGLGLATVLSVVRGASGEVRVESTPGKGTTFEVLIPLAIAP